MDPTQSFGSTQTQALTVPKTSSERRHDLDWLRVILFGLLIWFHLGVFTFWLFEDGDVPLTVFFVVDVMHQWRLAALFLISGMGTAFAFRRRDVKTFLNERLVRLGVPLLFATYVLLGGLIAPVETLWLMLVPFRAPMPCRTPTSGFSETCCSTRSCSRRCLRTFEPIQTLGPFAPHVGPFRPVEVWPS